MFFNKKSKIIILGIIGAILIVWAWSYSFSCRIEKISKNLSFSKNEFAKIKKEEEVKRNFSQFKEILREFKKLIEFGNELKVEK